MARQPGFFDLDDRYALLSTSGDPLERLASVVNFEALRYRLEKALKRSEGAKGGRPPYDPVLMFKILVLQALYTLSDDQAEFQIRDRLTFMRFLGLGMQDRVPDAKTIWLFREHLTQAKAMETLFARFKAVLEEKGYFALSGQIIDASLIAAQKHVMGLFVRTIGLARARTKIGMANLIYNMKRLVWLEGRRAPARRQNTGKSAQTKPKPAKSGPVGRLKADKSAHCGLENEKWRFLEVPECCARFVFVVYPSNQ